MRRLNQLLATFAVIFVFACSNNSTDPDNTGNGIEPVISETIGTAGGTVASEHISLTIPVGSFGMNAIIGISEINENTYGDNAASKTFLISGIPENYSTPLTIAVAYTGKLAHQTYVVAEETVSDPSTGGTNRIPLFIPATVAGDSVTAVLPARVKTIAKTSAGSDANDLLDFYITVVTDYITEESASHFKVKAPWYMKEFMGALVPHMDEAYHRMENLGFNFSLSGNTYGVLDTVLVYTDDDVIDPPVFQNIFLVGPSDAVALMTITSNATETSDIDEVAFDATRAIATLTAVYYTKGERIATLWFDIAMADWLARKWHNTGVIPSPVTLDPTIALKGIPVELGSDTESTNALISESRRFSPLIEYLDSRYNFTGPEQTLARIYDERYNGANLAESIKKITDMNSSEWWPEFLKDYITGQVWDIDPSVFLKSDARKDQVTLSEADTTHIFSDMFGDLAADIFQTTLDPVYADKVSTLRFTAESSNLQDEYLNVLLFGVRNNKPYYIGRGIDSIIADAGAASDGNVFLAVVASSLVEYPYHDDVQYSLTVSGAIDNNEYNQIVLQLPYVWRNYEWVANDGKTQPAGGAGGMFTWTLDMTEVEQNGNVYSGTTVDIMNSDSWGHYKTTSTITATITGTEASAKIIQVTENYETDAVTTQTFEFWGLPLITPVEGYLASYGTTMEQYVDAETWPDFIFTYYRVENVNPEGYTHETEYYARGANIHLR